jgi:hypothetical protein
MQLLVMALPPDLLLLLRRRLLLLRRRLQHTQRIESHTPSGCALNPQRDPPAVR